MNLKPNSYLPCNDLLNLLRRLNCISINARAEAANSPTMTQAFSAYIKHILDTAPSDKIDDEFEKLMDELAVDKA